MNLLIHGTKTFNDYPAFIRAMGVALSSIDDELNIWSIGPANINSYAREFVNIAGDGLKARNIKVSLNLIPPSLVDPMKFDNFYFFCKDGEWLSRFAKTIEADVDTLVFKY